MTIPEGNRLIAEFMGHHYSEDRGDGERGYLFPTNGAFNRRLMPSSMQYHSNWKWLMPVVEKIEAIKNSDDYEVDIFGNCCDIGGKIETVGSSKIDAVWQAIVQFIEKRNQ